MNTKLCSKCKENKPISEFSGHWAKKQQKYYYGNCKNCARIFANNYHQEHREKRNAWIREWTKNNPDKANERAKRYRTKIRLEVLVAYSGKVPKCKCCGEKEIKFLAIDHINGQGNKHRKESKTGVGAAFTHWLKRNNYPKGYQILCHNCNMAKGFYGQCPHKQ